MRKAAASARPQQAQRSSQTEQDTISVFSEFRTLYDAADSTAHTSDRTGEVPTPLSSQLHNDTIKRPLKLSENRQHWHHFSSLFLRFLRFLTHPQQRASKLEGKDLSVVNRNHLLLQFLCSHRGSRKEEKETVKRRKFIPGMRFFSKTRPFPSRVLRAKKRSGGKKIQVKDDHAPDG